MKTQYLCIHGHFYQPPREDPFSGVIPEEPGAFPYKNWNERIYRECYLPNTELRNYEKISFNIGPTLFEWLLYHDPQNCYRIVEQDRANRERYGVGNAMAQAYNHSILPLDSYRDKVTQIKWGIAHFEHYFGRKPQGMWLPEAAVDIETLSVLVDQGIQFTILAPWQADTEHLDPTAPYRVCLPEGKCIAVFFYHKELSGELSFNPSITYNADQFAQFELLPRYNREKFKLNEPQLLLVASDGELYGHHQPFRDRFLSHLVNGASEQAGIITTYPAIWLKKFPPKKTMAIREFTSWSCHHGIARWEGECDCTPGDGRWKAYLRRAFNHLAFTLDNIYETNIQSFGIDPWELRNQYIHVILGQKSLTEIIGELSGRRIDGSDINIIQTLLESQRERLRMFTSCGWFFEDFNRIEPQNNVAYAARAVHLIQKATEVSLVDQIARELRFVTSNRSGINGNQVFRTYIQRAHQSSS